MRAFLEKDLIINTGHAQKGENFVNGLSKRARRYLEAYFPERQGALSLNGFGRKLCLTTGILFQALWVAEFPEGGFK